MTIPMNKAKEFRIRHKPRRNFPWVLEILSDGEWTEIAWFETESAAKLDLKEMKAERGEHSGVPILSVKI